LQGHTQICQRGTYMQRIVNQRSDNQRI
jgi:hypothetical protein